MGTPRPTFADGFAPARNGFGTVRLGLAALVVLSHALILGGFGEALQQASGGALSLGSLAVDAFFCVSGSLVLRSFTLDARPGRFLLRRVLRIVPAYYAALFAVALIFAPLWCWLERGHLTAGLFSGDDGAFRYLLGGAALFYDEPRGIAGLLLGVPAAGVANAPLWSLRFEVFCYLAVAALGALGLLAERRQATTAAVALALLLGLRLAIEAADGPLAQLRDTAWDDLARLGACFCSGALTWALRARLPLSGWLTTAALLALPLALCGVAAPVLEPLLLCFLVHGLALGLRPGRADRFDLSYGLYLFTYPLQQTLALLGVPALGAPAFVAASLLGGVLLGSACRRFLEEPINRLRPFDRETTGHATASAGASAAPTS